MKRRVATNWKEKRFSRDGRGINNKTILPASGKKEGRETKRRREREMDGEICGGCMCGRGNGER